VAATVSGPGRAGILRRIRAAHPARPLPAAIPRGYTGPGAHAAGGDLAELLAGRLTDYGAVAHRSPAADAPAAIAAVLRGCGARRVALPEHLPAGWVTAVPDPHLDRPPLTNTELSSLDAVLTTVTVAIAQTGTLVLDHGPGQGRRELTLIPDVHVAVVPAQRIAAAVPDAVAAVDPAAPLTWISGPSATSDIELNRVQGVHGPRTLAVIILD
jgi:L-lactate dehydrogenase complex protein LldG